MLYQISRQDAEELSTSTGGVFTALVPKDFFECRTTRSTQSEESLYTSSGLLLEILKIREDYRKDPGKYPKAKDSIWE